MVLVPILFGNSLCLTARSIMNAPCNDQKCKQTNIPCKNKHPRRFFYLCFFGCVPSRNIHVEFGQSQPSVGLPIMAIASEMKEMNLSQLRNLRPRTLHEALLFLWEKVKCNVDFCHVKYYWWWCCCLYLSMFQNTLVLGMMCKKCQVVHTNTRLFGWSLWIWMMEMGLNRIWCSGWDDQSAASKGNSGYSRVSTLAEVLKKMSRYFPILAFSYSFLWLSWF